MISLQAFVEEIVGMHGCEKIATSLSQEEGISFLQKTSGAQRAFRIAKSVATRQAHGKEVPEKLLNSGRSAFGKLTRRAENFPGGIEHWEQLRGAQDMARRQQAFDEHLAKSAADLTAASRSEIAPKNFALTPKQSATGEAAYPIQDKAHAANALARVKQHGTSKQQSEVYKDVAKKFPELAARSGVPALKEKAASKCVGILAKKEKGSEFNLSGPAQGQHTPLTPPSPMSGASAGVHGKIAGAEATMMGRLRHSLAEGAGAHKAELAGLGILAALPADTLQAKLRSAKGEDWEHKSLLGGEKGHAVGDIVGLGTLAAPSLAHLAGH